MNQKFFLFLGHSDTDSAISKLKTSRVIYRKKMLESTTDNWYSILGIVRNHKPDAVIAKLSGRAISVISSPSHSDVAEALFDEISAIKNVFFVHESLFSGEQEDEGGGVGEDDDFLDVESYMNFVIRTYHDPTREECEKALNFLRSKGINLIPYRTNAELSVMAGSFVDDNERNLLFRVYVPSGQLYAAEADKLLTLFREWLGQIGRHKVRQDGYATSAGRVYEFYGDDKSDRASLSQDFVDFSKFLDLCTESPELAANQLTGLGIDRLASASLVAKYSREVRRLQVDLKHEREMRLLRIRQSAESEILNLNESAEAVEIIDWVEQYSRATVSPEGSSLGAVQVFPYLRNGPVSSVQVTVNNQVFPSAQSAIINNVQGTQHYGVEAKQLLELIQNHGENSSDLQSAVHEVEDPDAREADRLTARQRLKNFLYGIADEGQRAVIASLQKYLESKIGV
ncbi:hypothetical protein ABT174_35880 [Streptomyces sparsogenes]|uniref:hypothetical protein n=1 Tax=Streptomyces sparsogenes TaxID=67365 RepID=UPI0033215A02